MTMRLLYFPTVNGQKAAIALEEMRLDYEIEIINILEGGQAGSAFLEISPNGRIPALIDGDVRIFESGAILQYLGRKSGLFYPADEKQRARIDSWLHWQMAGIGPQSGNLNWFTRASAKPGRDPAETALAIHRFRKEVARLYSVLECQLASRAFICDSYSIADMACWPWVNKYHDHAGDRADFPHIAAWHRRITERPAVQRAIIVGKDDT